MERNQLMQLILPAILTGVICAILAIAGTFFILGQRVAKLETQVQNLNNKINEVNKNTDITSNDIASESQPIAESGNYEIERLEGEILFLREELMKSTVVLRDLLTEQAKKSFQLKNTLNRYKREIIDLEQRKAKFEENQSIRILIQYTIDTEKRAQKCKEILAKNGFQVKLSELSNLRSAYFRDRDFSEKVRYFDEELSQKAKEVAELLKPYEIFNLKKGKPSEKGGFSFLIWIL